MGLAFAGLPAERPDTVLYNGHIITVDRTAPRAQAIAISGDRIAQVGDNARIRALAGRGTRLIDLGGKTVVPGFIDAHSHPAYSGLQHLRAVDADLRSIAAIQAAVRERAARTPKGEWVLGFKYDDTKTSEGRYLTRADLDAATKDHPVECSGCIFDDTSRHASGAVAIEFSAIRIRGLLGDAGTRYRQ